MSVKVAAVSDTHGHFIPVNPCDVLCICGDIYPPRRMTVDQCRSWFKDSFMQWCSQQPASVILLVGGNHDSFLADYEEEVRGLLATTNVKYLKDESYEYRSEQTGQIITFYGTPWCHKFGNWSFMNYDNTQLEAVYNHIPYNLDVLLCHDAPYGISDICFENHPSRRTHIGCPALYTIVAKKQPKLLLHGHLHTANHSCEKLGSTEVYNVSITNERYSISFPPLYLELDCTKFPQSAHLPAFASVDADISSPLPSQTQQS